MAMGMAATTVVYAEDVTIQAKIFDSKEETQSWIDSFDTSKYEVKGDIKENEVSSVNCRWLINAFNDVGCADDTAVF